MVSAFHFLILLLALQLSTSYADGCTKQPFSTYHFWLEWDGVHRMFKTHYFGAVLDIKLEFYTPSEFQKFWYITSFYDCGIPGTLYMSTMAQQQFHNGQQYLFNDDIGTDVDLMSDTKSPFLSHKDGRLFQYNGAGYIEYVSLGSEVSSMVYVTKHRSSNSLVFQDQEVFWLTIPYITSSISSSTIRKRNTEISAVYLNGLDADLEVILYRIYKGFDASGNSLIGRAVAFRTLHTQEYIALNMTENGVIPLTASITVGTIFGPKGPQRMMRHYSDVNLVYYDDLARSQESVLLRPDIRDQNVVDERIFELLKQTDGSFRLLSTLHPDRYLATMDNGTRLVVTSLAPFHNSVFNYDFQLPDPGYPNTVKRLPTIPCRQISQLELYNCVNSSQIV